MVSGFNNLDVLNVTSFAVTGLNPATTYYYRVRANNTAGTSADSQTQVALTASASAPGIAVLTNSLTGFSYNGAGPSTAQSVSVTASNLTGVPGSLSVAGSSNYEVSVTDATSGFGTSALITYTNATLDATSVWIRLKANLAAGNYNAETISISGGGAANPATVSASGSVTKPTINLTTTNLGSFTGTNGLGSAAKTNTITGTNLLGDITIVATNFFEVSGDAGTTYTNNLVLTPTAGVISNAVLFRIASNAPVGSLGTNLVTLSSPETTNRTVQVIGTVVQGGLTLTANGSTNALVLNEGQSTNLVVTLSTNAPVGGVSVVLAENDADNSELSLSSSTLEIAEGATSGSVTLSALNDGIFDPNQTFAITATATNWTSSAALSVTVNNVDAAPASRISITSTNPASYSQNFNLLNTNTITGAFSATAGVQTSLGALLQATGLDGWYAGKRSGSGTAALPLTAGTGSDSSGGVYSFGAAGNAERALGTMSSGTTTPAFGALIKNDTTNTLTGLQLSFTAEFWRSSTSTTNVLTFGYGKVDGTTVTTDNFLTTAAANTASSLDITGPTPVATSAALDGNSAANKVAFSNVLFTINLAPGETMFIRWQDTDEGGNDAGLAIDDFSLTAEANPLLAPEFDTLGGTYYTDKTVKISNYGQLPAGAEVRYTVDGSTPTATSSLYNDASGILIVQGNGPVTLKAVAIQTSNSTSSAVSTVTYTLPKNVVDLTELRAAATGTTVYRVTGAVTYIGGTSFRNTKFFQDGGAGIQIDDSAGIVTTAYTVGDNVQSIMGRISLFQGQLQMVPVQDFGPAVSSGNSVTPLSRSLATLTDADQARLVTISGVEYQGANGTLVFGAGNSTVAIRDSSTGGTYSGLFRNIFGDSDVTGKVIPTGSITLTGIVQRATAGLTVGPRNSTEAGLPLAVSVALTSGSTTLPENGSGLSPVQEAAVTISRSGDTSAPLVVRVESSPAGQLRADLDGDGLYEDLSEPTANITIPAGTLVFSALVYVVPVNDGIFTGNRTASLLVTAAGYQTGSLAFSITEDEPPSGDTTPPVITLTGSATVTVAWGGSYSDAGATATDNVDPSVTVNSSGTVNTAKPGTYTITYTASDVAGNAATPVARTVTVSAPSNTPGADGLSGLLRYAFGANGPDDTVTKPTSTVSGGNLVLTAIVRTNDSKLAVVGEAVTSVANYTNAPSITPVTGSASGVSQAGVPGGTERQAFTVPQGADTRKFLRLKATLAP